MAMGHRLFRILSLKYCLICHGLKDRSDPLADKEYDYKNDAGFLLFNANLCERHEKELREHIDSGAYFEQR